MVRTRKTNNSSGESNGEAGMNGDQIRELVATEVSHALGEAVPGIIAALREEMTALFNERAIPPAATQVKEKVYQYRDFSACSPPSFDGDLNPIVCMRWISDIEGTFLTSGCPDGLKVRYAVNLLRGRAKDWCASALTLAERSNLPWEEFVVRFRAQFVPPVELERLTREFLDLTQTNESVQEINNKFREMSLFCPQFSATEEMKMFRYKDVLRTEIREFICNASYTSLNDMMEAARRRELELEKQTKRRRTVLDVTPISAVPKRSKFSDPRFGHEGGGSKPRDEEGERKCHKCGRSGHMSRDCKSPIMVCFNCNQVGHIRTNCPSLKVVDGGARNAPTATPLLITDGRSESSGAKTVQGRAYQLIGE